MDSLTQIVLGSTVAALAVPAAQRRKALLAGAVIATLPDLDSLPMLFLGGSDPVTLMTSHRGPSHSLLVLPWVALLLWLLLRWCWRPVREAPRAWLAAILLTLLTHPLLDALTVYGTQLLWPLPTSPVMWSSLWIIDPLYTLPLLFGVIAATVYGPRLPARRWLWAGALLSSAYILWSLAAKAMVESEVRAVLQEQGMQNAAHFSVPLPLNTFLWQIVVMTDDGYLMAERSLLADHKPLQFRHYASDTQAMAQALPVVPALQRLQWFNRGFMGARIDTEQRLIVSDLRMGLAPDFSFQFVVAKREGDGWQAIVPEQIRVPMRQSLTQALPEIWPRIFTEP